MIKFKGISLVLLGASLWGIMGIFVKGLQELGYSSIDVAFVRCALAAIALFIFMGITDRSCFKVNFKGLLVCLSYGICVYSIGFMGYNISVERIPVSVATVLMFMAPIWVALFEVVIFKVKLKKSTIVIIGLCVIGAALVANLISVSGESLDPIGIIAGVINGIGMALQLTITKYFSPKYSSDTMVMYGFAGAAIVLALFSDLTFIGAGFMSGELTSLIWNLFGVGVLCTMVANFSYVKASEFISPTMCGILSAIEVVVGVIVGYIFFGESFTTLQFIGAIIIVGSASSSVIIDALDDKKLEKLKNIS